MWITIETGKIKNIWNKFRTECERKKYIFSIILKSNKNGRLLLRNDSMKPSELKYGNVKWRRDEKQQQQQKKKTVEKLIVKRHFCWHWTQKAWPLYKSFAVFFFRSSYSVPVRLASLKEMLKAFVVTYIHTIQFIFCFVFFSRSLSLPLAFIERWHFYKKKSRDEKKLSHSKQMMLQNWKIAIFNGLLLLSSHAMNCLSFVAFSTLYYSIVDQHRTRDRKK